MTIREMEERTGMSRANIRYYESQGLLCPARGGNGYRNYSEADADALAKVRLLRSLDLSIEDILSVQGRKKTLHDALAAQLEVLEGRQAGLERSRAVAKAMLSAGEGYETLDPAGYLLALEPSAAPEEPARLNLPWRRYLARELDFGICAAVTAFLPVISAELEFLLSLVLMLLAEPAWLAGFGTTPGKAVFGIRVTDPEGRRLHYGAALERTWLVLWEGMLLRVPILCLYALGKSWLRNEEDEPLAWEAGSELTFRDDRRWRYAVYVIAMVAVLAVMTAGIIWKGV